MSVVLTLRVHQKDKLPSHKHPEWQFEPQRQGHGVRQFGPSCTSKCLVWYRRRSGRLSMLSPAPPLSLSLPAPLFVWKTFSEEGCCDPERSQIWRLGKQNKSKSGGEEVAGSGKQLTAAKRRSKVSKCEDSKREYSILGFKQFIFVSWSEVNVYCWVMAKERQIPMCIQVGSKQVSLSLWWARNRKRQSRRKESQVKIRLADSVGILMES